MRESRTYGSVRGALSNERPYRDRCARNDVEGLSLKIKRYTTMLSRFAARVMPV
jgi:hypothetical protein